MPRDARLTTALGVLAATVGGYLALRSWPDVTRVVLEMAHVGVLYVVARG